jgi:hypothetical protein
MSVAELFVTVEPVFDEAFFATGLPEKARQFSREHGEDMGISVEVVTLAGDRLDILEVTAAEDGVMLVTRDTRLVFLPYPNITHVDVSLLRDHRIPSAQLLTPT